MTAVFVNPVLSDELEQRIQAFLPIQPQPHLGEELQKVVRSGDKPRILAVITLLTDMALAGQKTIGTQHDSIQISNFLHFHLFVGAGRQINEDQEIKEAQYNALIKIGTPESVRVAASSFADIQNPLDRKRLWTELTSDVSVTGIRKLSIFTKSLGYPHPTVRESANPNIFSEKEYKECLKQAQAIFARIYNEAEPDSGLSDAAYDGLKILAERRKEALRALFELDTPKSFGDSRTLFYAHARANADNYDSFLPKKLVKLACDLQTPNAYKVLVAIATGNSDLGLGILNELKAKAGVDGTEEAISDITEFYVARLKERAQELQSNILRLDTNNDYNLVRIYGCLSVIEAMKIMALTPYIGDETEARQVDLIHQFSKRFADARPYQFDTLLQRASYQSLYGTIDLLIEINEEFGDAVIKSDKLEQWKRDLLAAIANAPKERCSSEEKYTLYEHLARLPQTTNDEIAKACISALVARKQFGLLERMITRDYAQGFHQMMSFPRDIAGKPSKIKYYDFVPLPQYAEFTIQTIINSEAKSRAALQAIRCIANTQVEGNLRQVAHDYFTGLNTHESLNQLRLLGNLHAVAYYKTLSDELAIPALRKAFAQNAYGAAEAILDKRQAAQQKGGNDFAMYDDALREFLQRFGNKIHMKQEIAEGNSDIMASVFRRVHQETGLPDLGKAFEATRQVIIKEAELVTAQLALEAEFSKLEI
jgi:hypothetical protein